MISIKSFSIEPLANLCISIKTQAQSFQNVKITVKFYLRTRLQSQLSCMDLSLSGAHPSATDV